MQIRKTLSLFLQPSVCQAQAEGDEEWKIREESLRGGGLQVWELQVHVQEARGDWPVLPYQEERFGIFILLY